MEIQRLKAAGLKMSADTPLQNLSDALNGKTIVISGTFSISRDEMKKLIELHGGKNGSSISGKTSFLLAGNKGPEKLSKAEQLGVPVIDEDKFRSMLPEGAVPEKEEEEIEPDLFGGMV